MLMTGDNFKQTSKIGCFDKVGDTFKVTDISNDGMITFSASYGMGMMSYDEFNSHFEKVEHQPWSDWIQREGYSYRTNNKQVKIKKDGFSARSSCHPSDSFDLEKGIAIALARVGVKEAQSRLAKAIS